MNGRLTAALEIAGRAAYRAAEELGRTAAFTAAAGRSLVHDRFRARQTVAAALEIGVRSWFVIFLTATFTGLVFALETSYAFKLFGAEPLIGSSVTLSLTRELAPVLTALMVTARAGSAMAAEIGSMRVSEQIDALEAMAVSPVAYLVVPRVVAATAMVPVLAVWFDLIGFLSAWYVTIHLVGANPHTVLEQIHAHVDLLDLYAGIAKATVFGWIVAVVCTSRGFAARGGAQGVGVATTEAVVISSVAVLAADYFLTAVIFGY